MLDCRVVLIAQELNLIRPSVSKSLNFFEGKSLSVTGSPERSRQRQYVDNSTQTDDAYIA